MTEEEQARAKARSRRLDDAFDLGMLVGVGLMVYGAYLIAVPLAVIAGGFFLAVGCFALARANARLGRE